jgi:hypothetical protein
MSAGDRMRFCRFSLLLVMRVEHYVRTETG